MRVQVQICGECVAVGCDGGATVASVGRAAIAKMRRLRPTLCGSVSELEIREFRKTIGGSLLDPDDAAADILRDGDFVAVVLKSDLPAHEEDNWRDTDLKPLTTPKAGVKPMKNEAPTEILTLDGQSLTTQELVRCGAGVYKLALSPTSARNISASSNVVEKIVKENQMVYGITTGFGNFSNVRISLDEIAQLQLNLIRSHACGVGPPLPPNRVRMLMALRINVLAKGYSGLTLENVQRLIAAFNAFCIPWVPEKGTVGCSGDLIPLSHLALGLMGEGSMWSPETDWAPAAQVLSAHNLEPIQLGPKEGLALINGTQMVTALGTEAVERAEMIARQADVIAALALDVLKGTTRAFDAEIHQLRPHCGQLETAARLRALLHSDSNPSQIAESHRFCGRVQDAYTLRCVPQVHGIVHDTIRFVKGILSTEINSATDNPLVFGDRDVILSCGNFHGEYPAKALDYLAIGVSELAQMSERRVDRLMNPQLSGLPPFLTNQGGLNSGFMLVQVAAASLVSENKVLCHPASADSIPTSLNQEDHVSMGGFAARKALMILENVEQVLAMELLAVCQGMEYLKPLTSTQPLQSVYNLVRKTSAPVDRDRSLSEDIQNVAELLQRGKVWSCVKTHLYTMGVMEAVDPTVLNVNGGTPSPTSVVQCRFEGDDSPVAKRVKT